MCGIVAHLGFNEVTRLGEESLRRLNDLMRHRGPDDEGIFMDSPVELAMRRLSIVDIKGGHQPMTTADGRFTIVFNGEIYNHGELRRQLLSLGFPVKTHSDTEVLLYAYAAWGKECLAKLNGMFAFVLWDKRSRELFVARDRMGVKPLYYAIDGKRALFASELTPIIQSGLFDLRLDHKAIADYLSYWYICEPDTVFQGVRQLPPGHYAVVRDGAMRMERYWEIPVEKERGISFEVAAEELEALLKDAVRLRLNADVPFGTFLSGGVDSGIVTGMAAAGAAKPLRSFGIGFKDPSYDETSLARLTAARHHVDLDIHIMETITPALVDEIITAFDEPLGNASYVPTYLLARAARVKMTMVLTGDGGDELFGGYPTYQAPYYQKMWRRLPQGVQSLIRSAIAHVPVSHGRISLDYRLKQLMQGIDRDYRRGHQTWREVASLELQKDLWKPEVFRTFGHYDPFDVMGRYFDKAGDLSACNQLMYADMNTYLLNDHLRKVDRMTMAHGLEARLPFMDYRVVEFAMRLPAEHKVSFRQTKRILKSVGRAYLPSEVIKAKKKGLTAPIAGWISNELKDYMADQLKGGVVDALFDRRVIEGLCQDHWGKRKDNSRILWGLLTLQVWYKKKGRV